MTVREARAYLEQGHFGAATMAPKVLACVRFVEAGGESAIIAGLDDAASAWRGEAGTRIVP